MMFKKVIDKFAIFWGAIVLAVWLYTWMLPQHYIVRPEILSAWEALFWALTLFTCYAVYALWRALFGSRTFHLGRPVKMMLLLASLAVGVFSFQSAAGIGAVAISTAIASKPMSIEAETDRVRRVDVRGRRFRWLNRAYRKAIYGSETVYQIELAPDYGRTFMANVVDVSPHGLFVSHGRTTPRVPERVLLSGSGNGYGLRVERIEKTER